MTEPSEPRERPAEGQLEEMATSFVAKIKGSQASAYFTLGQAKPEMPPSLTAIT